MRGSSFRSILRRASETHAPFPIAHPPLFPSLPLPRRSRSGFACGDRSRNSPRTARPAQSRLRRLEGLLVMTQPRGHPIPGTGYRHFGQLEDGVVGSGEPPIRRQPRQTSVRHVTGDEFTQGNDLLNARLMRLHRAGGQQGFPTHYYLLLETPSRLTAGSGRNGSLPSPSYGTPRSSSRWR